MIAIDVGCARYNGDYSIEHILQELDPDIVFGFDPNWESGMFSPPEDLRASIICQSVAAWIYDGVTDIRKEGLYAQMGPGREVPCIDLARFIRDLPEDEIVLKLDCEGAEYDLLDHLLEQNVDGRLSLAWVEWHDFGVKNPAMRREWIENHIACEIVEWRR